MTSLDSYLLFNLSLFGFDNEEKIYPVNLVDKPTFITPFEFEKLDINWCRRWAGENWHFTIYITIAYIVCIFATQEFMKTRKPFRLTGLLTTWNLMISVFSIIVFIRTAPEFIHVLTSPNGFHNSICHWTSHNYATAFWCWLFLVSKVVELGDTAFVVLRKQKLAFIHWYHHASTMISWWVMYLSYEPNSLWYVVMNSYIHGIMYSYFALKALGFRINKNVSMFITSLQLVQMGLGVLVNIYALNLMWIQGRGSECDRGDFGIKVSLYMYSSFLLLFGHFFYKSYFGKTVANLAGYGITSKAAPVKGLKTD